MKERFTQVLLALIAALLVLNLFHPSSSAQKEPTNGVLRAEGFELVNNKGQVVAQLYAGDDGGGNIRLRSGDGVVRVKLGAATDGSALLLLDQETEPALWLVADSDGTRLTLAEKGKGKKILKP